MSVNIDQGLEKCNFQKIPPKILQTTLGIPLVKI